MPRPTNGHPSKPLRIGSLASSFDPAPDTRRLPSESTASRITRGLGTFVAGLGIGFAGCGAVAADGMPQGSATGLSRPATNAVVTHSTHPPSASRAGDAGTCPPAPARAGRVIQVGSTRAVRTVSEAARLARDDDTVEIDGGVYRADVAVWRQSRLTIRGVNGRAVLDAAETSAAGKGIFVTSGDDVRIESLEFANAKSPDLNGSGIRMEGGSLVVCRSVFRNNEEGILTSGEPTARLEIHDTRFEGNAFAYSRGYSHSVYVGRIARLVVTGSYFTRTQVGHLLKSRARENHISYNRLTDEAGGTASYEIDLPDGGMAYVVGNLIQQSARTENPTIVSFGAESMSVHPRNEIHLAHNTLVNHRPKGCTWLYAAPGARVDAANNLLVGPNCRFAVPADATSRGQATAAPSDFVDADRYDFRPRQGTPASVPSPPAGSANGVSLEPVRKYRHVASSVPLSAPATHAGAFPPAR